MKSLRLASILFLAMTQTVMASKLTGNFSLEWRGFVNESQFANQKQSYTSMSMNPEWSFKLAQGKQQVVFSPFIRIDEQDPERSHSDIREFFWLYSNNNFEWRIGVRKLFWGVTESQHLVDVINQTDLVENLDGEDKLGQPMVNLSILKDWGSLDFYLLPYFRERSFLGSNSRLRPFPLPIASEARYESRHENVHLDYAFRISGSLNDWEMAASYFSGTNREPVLLLENFQLVPYYPLMQQLGLELQGTKGSWLYKMETIFRYTQPQDYIATTLGYEYTFNGIAGSRMDLGVVNEFSFDDRHSDAPTPFQKDLMMGFRLAFNDVQSSDALLGMVLDLDTDTFLLSLEASRRLGDHWRIYLEARGFSNVNPSDPLLLLSNDEYLQIELAYFF